MSQCPSCGQFTGPHEACPYCGARLTGRTPIRAIKIAAILLASVGLAALWFAATHTEIPLVQVGRASATMNMAYVRLAGRCTRNPSYDPESDYLSFWIDDGTGEILVSAYRSETRQMIAEERVPALGDQVEVAGTLRVREDFTSLTINVPEQVTVTRPEPVEREIGSLSIANQYLRVRVRGEVESNYEPYDGFRLITLRDGTGTIPIAVGEDLIALTGELPRLSTGQPVEVVATVSRYEDTPQLVLASTDDVVVLDTPVLVATETAIGQLTAADDGQVVIVEGTIDRVDRFSAGVKFWLQDDTGSVILLLWTDVYQALPDPAALAPGTSLRVEGQVSEYQGDLEVIPQQAEDLQVLAVATPVPTPAVEVRPIGQVTGADVGQTVQLTGTLGDAETFSAGIKFPLEDDTGTIVLLLWQNVYEAIPQADALIAGTQVEVTGRIEEYQGELEIIPEAHGVIVE